MKKKLILFFLTAALTACYMPVFAAENVNPNEIFSQSVSDHTEEPNRSISENTELSLSANSDFGEPDSSRDWSRIMDFPSKQALTEFNEKSADRSPYLGGWLNIEPDMKFSEYSIDFKADYLPYGTYFCCAQMMMDLSSLEQEYDEVHIESGPSFYAGLQMWEPKKGSGSIMSFWDINCKDKSGKTSTIHAKLVYPENDKENAFDHEGNGVNYMRNYAWEKGCWYRMLLQCGRSEENGHTLVYQWICNLKTGNWTKLCCYDTGLTDSCFVGNTALFLENYLPKHAGDIRTIEYKNIRILPKDETQWIPIKQTYLYKAYDYPGSFCFGADDEQFWMITTGLENRSLQQCGQANTYNVTFCQSDPPYTTLEEKKTEVLKFKNVSVTKTYGDAAFTNTLSKDTDDIITYTEVAKVDAAGKVTIKNIGTARITASVKEGLHYPAQSVSYTIKVNPKATSISSLKATSRGFIIKVKEPTPSTADFQIQYSTSKNFKNAKLILVKKNATKSISKLKGKKKYYVRVRTYKNTLSLYFCTDIGAAESDPAERSKTLQPG